MNTTSCPQRTPSVKGGELGQELSHPERASRGMRANLGIMSNHEAYARNFEHAVKIDETKTVVGRPLVQAGGAVIGGAIALYATATSKPDLGYLAAGIGLICPALQLMLHGVWKWLIKRTAAQFAAAHPR